MRAAPLVIDGPSPRLLPARPLTMAEDLRDGRPLYVTERTIYMKTLHGWLRIPAGYVTDFGSIPWFATWLTLLRMQPLGRHAWAALAHDWGYAIGQVGMRPIYDDIFRERMEVDGVWQPRRAAMYRAVRLGGQGGYDAAPRWWRTENFADPDTGSRVAPPFYRESAYAGGPYGMRPQPDWSEPLSA